MTEVVFLTLELALVTTLSLLLVGTPLAWWLAHTKSWWKNPVGALVALPLVLPPTVLGFYILLLLAPEGWLGRWVALLDFGPRAFSFSGLVLGSMIYSLPFAVQPLRHSFEALGPRPLEVAASLRLTPWQSILKVILPLTRTGFISAAVLVFAHTIGEFGVVLMIGGNIPGKTKLVSMAIYDYVESLQYEKAHMFSAALLLLSFLVLLGLQATSRGKDRAWLK